MNENALQAKREYQREWRKKNRERVRLHNSRYWQKRAQKQEKERQGGEDNDS
ncbi:MAG: phosphatase [Defluviitaleaceae bacterium]|nr:phosphatase [Defluviitaleaceae bacterium]